MPLGADGAELPPLSPAAGQRGPRWCVKRGVGAFRTPRCRKLRVHARAAAMPGHARTGGRVFALVRHFDENLAAPSQASAAR
jgi:hypothetical protein